MNWFLILLKSLFPFELRQSLTIFVLGLALLMTVAEKTQAAPTCIELFQELAPGRVGDIFGSVSSNNALDYGQIGFRNLSDVSMYFSGVRIELGVPKNPLVAQAKFEFHEIIESIKPGEVVYDSGGASGLVGMELASRLGAKVTTLSLHDFFPAIERFARDFKPSDIKLAADNMTIEKVGALRPEFMQSLAVGVGLSFGLLKRHHDLAPRPDDFNHLSREDQDAHLTNQIYLRARNILNRFVQKSKMLMGKGLVNYFIGPAEDFFKTSRQKAKLIIDVYGAYFYSPNRIQLLQDYYNQLSEDGKAFVFLHKDTGLLEWIDTGVGPAGFIRHPVTKQYIEIIHYLKWRYPTIFTTQNFNGLQTLVIHRDPNIAVLDLGLIPDTTFMTVFRGSLDFVYPTRIIYALAPGRNFFR